MQGPELRRVEHVRVIEDREGAEFEGALLPFGSDLNPDDKGALIEYLKTL